MDKETLYILKNAASEINQLRQANNLMGARLDMFDKMMSLFQTAPFQQGQGYSPDIVYDINKLVAVHEQAAKEQS